MADFDLLSVVQPADGWFALFANTSAGALRQTLFDNRTDFDKAVAKLTAAGNWNIFFGVAKYASDVNRKKENVQALRTFWLDLDCRGKKATEYKDVGEALVAVRTLCKTTGLPKPILATSGGGLHAYWPLSEDISRTQWEHGAAALAAACHSQSIKLDPAVMEVARVMRLPGTLNYKSNPPALAEVISEAHTPISFEDFISFVGYVAPATLVPTPTSLFGAAPKGNGLTTLGSSLKQEMFKKANFGVLIERSEEGYGCEQLRHAHAERATLPEPLWRAALSVANVCDDRIEAIKSVSEDHPGYNLQEAVAKAEGTAGPYTCQEFLKLNPTACEGCALWGRIKSPVMVGMDDFAPPGVDLRNLDPETGKPYIIPAYPAPFYRGIRGGIWRAPLEGEEGKNFCVYEYDLYIVKRLMDESGYSFIVRYHHPSDGVRNFTITNKQYADKVEFRKLLAAEDVTVTDFSYGHLLMFFHLFMNQFRVAKKVDQMRSQFGWADNDSKFIVGDREVTALGTFYSPPSKSTSSFIKHLGPRGSFDKWREVFELYGMPGMEPHAFAALTAFGAPLLRFFGQRGLVLNLIHPSSGTGKTTVLHMCNSVWGSPDGLVSVKEDTMNARLFRMGVFNNLPVTIDEATNMQAIDTSNFLYSSSQGKAKDRMMSSSNELRKNNTTWQTMVLCTSNSSFYEKLSRLKQSPDGELMRLIEYKIAKNGVLETERAKEMFDYQLLENYGHAGLIYADYCLKNLEAVQQLCTRIQKKIDGELDLTQRERFWSAGAGANIAGGMLAKQSGVLDWDLDRIYKWAGTVLIPDLREQTTPPLLSNASAVVGDFINRHMQHVLVVKAGADLRTNIAPLPIMEPKRDLLIRYEPDTKLMYIVIRAFRNDCVEQQVNYRETIKELEALGIYLRYENKRLAKGTKIISPAVPCMVLNCNHPDFIDLSSLETPESAN